MKNIKLKIIKKKKFIMKKIKKRYKNKGKFKIIVNVVANIKLQTK